MNIYLNVLRNNYANFTGRARRQEYWMFQLINTVILFVLYLPVAGFLLPSMLASRQAGQDLPSVSPLVWLVLLLYVVYALAVLVPSLALTVRRLHDAGYSGWLFLVAFVPFVGSIGLLVLTILDSKPGANKWGPNPKGIGAAATPF
jgi:uncharacterized membrane protein YhaH (DUF805 family)